MTSALNAHRFAYHLIDNPLCYVCGDTYETTSHFLFHCPSYSDARRTMYDSFADLGINTPNKNTLLQVILHGTNYLNVADSLHK